MSANPNQDGTEQKFPADPPEPLSPEEDPKKASPEDDPEEPDSPDIETVSQISEASTVVHNASDEELRAYKRFLIWCERDLKQKEEDTPKANKIRQAINTLREALENKTQIPAFATFSDDDLDGMQLIDVMKNLSLDKVGLVDKESLLKAGYIYETVETTNFDLSMHDLSHLTDMIATFVSFDTDKHFV